MTPTTCFACLFVLSFPVRFLLDFSLLYFCTNEAERLVKNLRASRVTVGLPSVLTSAMCLLTPPRCLSLSLSSSICSSPDSPSTAPLPSIITRLFFSQCRPLKVLQDGGGTRLFSNISMTHRSMCSKRVSHVFKGFVFLLRTTGPAVFELVCRICFMLNHLQTTRDSSEATHSTCSHEEDHPYVNESASQPCFEMVE